MKWDPSFRIHVNGFHYVGLEFIVHNDRKYNGSNLSKQ